MVDVKTVRKQLKSIKFGASIWNQPELNELPHILHEHETILEAVNGIYEGGVALLVATNSRLLLIDKKPLNYLTVEDLRFDMINEIDYSHRMMGATITISTGSKSLKFKSYNQPRLRSLINQVQERMSLIKKEQSDKADNQQQHLEEINKQLQMYLLAQHQQLQQQINNQAAPQQPAELPKPDARLSDYLFAQRLLDQFRKDEGNNAAANATAATPATAMPPVPEPVVPPQAQTQEDIVKAARKEIFGAQQTTQQPVTASTYFKGFEVNPMKVAYSKLPMMLRNRKFGRPSFHAHSQEQAMPTGHAAAPSHG